MRLQVLTVLSTNIMILLNVTLCTSISDESAPFISGWKQEVTVSS
jgi:hypothetical protein